MIQKFSIGRRIALGFTIILVLFSVLGALGYFGISGMGDQISEVVERSRLEDALSQREIDHLNWVSKVCAPLIDPGITSIDVQTDPHKCAWGKWFYSENRDRAEELVPGLSECFTGIEDPHDRLHSSAKTIESLLAEGKRDEASLYYCEVTKPALVDIQKYLQKATKLTEKTVTQTNQEAMESAGFLQKFSLIITGTALLLGIALSYYIAHVTTLILRKIIGRMRAGAGQTASVSSEVSSSSQALAEGASRQAASLEETSSSIEEMVSMIKQSTQNAQEAALLAKDARDITDQGEEAMERMSGAIDRIKHSSDETSKIIRTIDDIAFQTNLLALNAAVEAARAGESGKGFAVVAEEVRTLALRSAEAARSTSDLIEESVNNANNGVNISEEVAEVLKRIAHGNRKVTDLISEISAASKEQSIGVEQISQSIGDMDRVTQANAASAEESASSSEELSSQAEELKELVLHLESIVNGSKHFRTRSGGNETDSSTWQMDDFSSGVDDEHGMESIPCWEHKKCGRTPGGAKEKEPGVCPAYPDYGHLCWQVAGTFCGGDVQGSMAQKLGNCMQCEFYQNENRIGTSSPRREATLV